MLAASLNGKNIVSSFGARFSVPFALASILYHGRSGLKSFDDEAVANRQVQALVQRVFVHEEPAFTARFPAEQPVHVDDREGLALVTRMVPVTVEADEAAGSLKEVYDLVSRRTVDAVSLKIPKLGGLRNTLAAARICEAGGIKYRLGAAVGSRLLSAHAIHMACALRNVDYACELGEFDRLLDDSFEGIEIKDGFLHLPEGPGCGVRWKQ